MVRCNLFILSLIAVQSLITFAYWFLADHQNYGKTALHCSAAREGGQVTPACVRVREVLVTFAIGTVAMCSMRRPHAEARRGSTSAAG
jgi:hypothetical protein